MIGEWVFSELSCSQVGDEGVVSGIQNIKKSGDPRIVIDSHNAYYSYWLLDSDFQKFCEVKIDLEFTEESNNHGNVTFFYNRSTQEESCPYAPRKDTDSLKYAFTNETLIIKIEEQTTCKLDQSTLDENYLKATNSEI